MIMQIFGWIVLLLFVMYMTVATGLVSFFNLGEFTIGGAKNTISEKLVALFLMCVTGYGWYLVVTHAPFLFILK